MRKARASFSLNNAAEISRQLPPFVMRVGVFVNAPGDFVMRAISECNLSMLQFHGDENAEFCTQFGLMSMKAIRVRDAESLAEFRRYQTDAYLLDAFSSTAPGGTGETIQLGAGGSGAEVRQTDFSRRAD